MYRLDKTARKALNRSYVLGLALLLLMLFLLTADINIYLTESLTPTIYYSAIAIIFSFGVYFRMGRFCTEEKLMLAFVLWTAITRICHGFPCFFEEYFVLLVFSLPAASLCILRLMGKRERMYLFKALCLAGVLYYTSLSVLSLYAAVGKKTLCNPITQKMLVSWFDGRLSLFELHPNRCGQFFAGGILYSFLLAVNCKNKPLKLCFCVTALLSYLAVSLTGSRTVMVAVAFSAAFAAVIYLNVKLHKAGKLRRIAVCVAVSIVLIPAVYRGFDLSSALLTEINRSAAPEINTLAADSTRTVLKLLEGEADSTFSGTRSGQSSSEEPLNGRFKIYKSVPLLLKKEPIRLLIGSEYNDRMSFTNQYTFEALNLTHDTLHNSYLEILVLCGIPGLLIVLAFTALAVCRAFRCALADSEQPCMSTRLLAVPVLAFFICSLPESFLFFSTDFQTMMFFVTVGVLLGENTKIE